MHCVGKMLSFLLLQHAVRKGKGKGKGKGKVIPLQAWCGPKGG
jgi:hypothetical protein